MERSKRNSSNRVKETRRANTSRKSIDIYDARPGLANGEITLDGSGFTLAKFVHAVEDFRDIEATARRYYPAVEKLVANLSGAKEVFVRDHLVRTEIPIDFNDGYARFVHCDYNMKRLREMSESLLETRVLSRIKTGPTHGLTPGSLLTTQPSTIRWLL